MDSKDFLFELGTEELPPKSLHTLSQALGREIEAGLQKAALQYDGVTLYATPRRLAVWVHNLQLQQADQATLRRGPAERAAFDADGNPTKALVGFARSCGVAVEELERIDTPKGVWMGITVTQQGVSAKALLPELLQGALDRLPIPKRMRWGASDVEFLRPVHWVVALLGEEVVPATLYNIESGSQSRGHRFHRPQPITITTAADYAGLLEQEGMVVADSEQRKRRIGQAVIEAAQQLGGEAVVDPALLDEVTALVEWPVAISGSFERRFLEVPQEALIASMQGHQKYFPVVDGNGQLMAHFITISNIESLDPSKVQHGNERVIRPRLADAAFFWQQDLKRPLQSLQDGLQQVVYQEKLGSLFDKSQRVATLAATIAMQLGADADHARRAALLAKCDLLTQMVKEFPELQGVMGRYYAGHGQEPEEVATALDEQYMPRFSGDQLPDTSTGEALALAERLDALVGIFGIGMIPSGDKDPFALRRAALGVLRIMVEKQRPLDLRKLLEAAAAGYGDKIDAESTDRVFDFILERLRGYYHERGIGVALFDAVLSCRPTRPLDFDHRINAVQAFVRDEASASLSAANKRIHNLLKKSDESVPEHVDESLFEEDAERSLALELASIRSQLDDALGSDQYGRALEVLSTLRAPVDQFFEAVMVMSDDAAIRHNRLALLSQLRAQFLRIADISLLHTS
jgi:glycyl-tRNA synthetase beta chain